MDERTCIIEGCTRPGPGMCPAHRTRLRRHGTVGSPEVSDRVKRPCQVDGCTRRREFPDYCKPHQRRADRTGSPTGDLPPRVGELNNYWQGQAIGYGAAHTRVRAMRGPARQQACAHCSADARHWAYDHADPNEKISDEGPYSPDPSHYLPLCVSCHKRFDLARLAT